MDLMKNFIEKNMPEKAAPDVTVGDTVRVHLRVKEGNRERIQVFEGTVIAESHEIVNSNTKLLRHSNPKIRFGVSSASFISVVGCLPNPK